MQMRLDHQIKLNYSTWISAAFILVFLINCFTLFHLRQAISPCFSLTFLILLLIFIDYITTQQISVTMLLLIMIPFVNVVIDALLSRQAQVGLSYFRKLVMFECTVVLLCTTAYLSVNRFVMRLIAYIPMLMGMLMVISFFFLGNRTIIAHAITLGFSNPNFAGIWLTHSLFYTVYNIISHKQFSIKLILSVLCVFLLLLIYKTFSRSCFVGIVVFAGLLLWGLISRRSRLHKIILWGAAFFPILFVFAYLGAVQTRWFAEAFSFLVRTGKKLSARNKIWLLALSTAKNKLLLGNYSEISGGLGMSQLHNAHLDVLCSYGLLPLLLFIGLLFESMKKINDSIRTPEQYVALSAFIGCLFISCFEAYFVAGSMGLYFLTCGFLILAAGCSESEPEHS